MTESSEKRLRDMTTDELRSHIMKRKWKLTIYPDGRAELCSAGMVEWAGSMVRTYRSKRGKEAIDEGYSAALCLSTNQDGKITLGGLRAIKELLPFSKNEKGEVQVEEVRFDKTIPDSQRREILDSLGVASGVEISEATGKQPFANTHQSNQHRAGKWQQQLFPYADSTRLPGQKGHKTPS